MKNVSLIIFFSILSSATCQQAKAQGSSKKPYFGATIAILDSLPSALLKHYKSISKRGIMVQQVFEGSPAKQAGLQVNDVLEKLNDSTLVHPRQFVDLLWTYKAGDEIKLTLYRQNKRIVKGVKLTAKPDTELK